MTDLDPAVAGLDRRPKPQQILVHRGAQTQDPLQSCSRKIRSCT